MNGLAQDLRSLNDDDLQVAIKLSIEEDNRRRRVRESRDKVRRDVPEAGRAEAPGIFTTVAEGEPSTLDMVEWVFEYHAPGPTEVVKYRTIRAAAKYFANMLLQNVPAGIDRDESIRKLRECVMTANAAIALKGRSL